MVYWMNYRIIFHFPLPEDCKLGSQLLLFSFSVQYHSALVSNIKNDCALKFWIFFLNFEGTNLKNLFNDRWFQLYLILNLQLSMLSHGWDWYYQLMLQIVALMSVNSDWLEVSCKSISSFINVLFLNWHGDTTLSCHSVSIATFPNILS